MGMKKAQAILAMLPDAGLFVGFALFVYGLYLIRPAFAPLIGGALLCAGSFFIGYARSRSARNRQ
jgi:hypothetical protein